MKPLKFIISIVLPVIAGAIGSLATFPNIPSWYVTLNKPWFSPPNWVFGPVWTILYVLMGISLYLVWTAQSKESKLKAFILFAIQLALNTLWSIVFFALHAPFAAVGVILLLFVMIVLTIKEFWSFSRIASWLLVPYVAWVMFASCLNIAVALVN